MAHLGFVDLWQLLKINRPELKDKSFLPCFSPLLSAEKDMFKTIAKRDFVLYHPYDSFEAIIDLLKEAAQDPSVLEICITMYRMDHNSPVVERIDRSCRKRQESYRNSRIESKIR